MGSDDHDRFPLRADRLLYTKEEQTCEKEDSHQEWFAQIAESHCLPLA
jgi:hypothetical protein